MKTNSTNGTKTSVLPSKDLPKVLPSNPSKIDATSICRIIKACKRAKVAEFSYEGVSIKFSSDQKAEPIHTQTHPSEETTANEALPAVYLSEEDKESQRQIEELQLAIDDPVAYEEQQLSEYVENDRMRTIHAQGIKDRGSQ